MDTTLNPVSGTSQPYTPALKALIDSVPSSAPQSDTATQPTASVNDDAVSAAAPASSQEQYEAALRQAALSFKNVYAVSDQDFSIFKDSTGKYITRYVSLRDGKVTYVPEPTLVKQIAMSGGSAPSHLTISA